MGNSSARNGLGSAIDVRQRDASLHALGDFYAAGAISAQELDSRIQAVLGAETEADLAAAMGDLDREPAAEQEPAPEALEALPAGPSPRVPDHSRLVTAVVALTTGSALVAAVGPRSDLAEFSAGLGLGALGFLAHWWWTAGADQPRCGCADQSGDASSAPSDEPRPVLRDEADESPTTESPTIESTALGAADAPADVFASPRQVTTRSGSGGRPRPPGIIPGQRTRD